MQKNYFKIMKFHVYGCVDLKEFILTKCVFGKLDNIVEKIYNASLDKICNLMLGYTNNDDNDDCVFFKKNKQITMSNWELNELSKSQIAYAANDAIYGYYAFLQCIINIENKKFRLFMDIT